MNLDLFSINSKVLFFDLILFFRIQKKEKKPKFQCQELETTIPSLKSVNTIYNMLWDMLWETWNFIHLIKIHVNSYYWVELYRKAQFF